MEQRAKENKNLEIKTLNEAYEAFRKKVYNEIDAEGTLGKRKTPQ